MPQQGGTTVNAMRRRNLMRLNEKLPDVGIDAPRITVGVCAMAKKALSKPMHAILTRMNTADEFEIITFPEEVILNDPVDVWPRCDCLMAWHSEGFPLGKAQAYVRLRNPFVINDVFGQSVLLDRRQVYQTLMEHKIPLPNHIIVNRTPKQTADETDPPGFIETGDLVELNGKVICKPFVEKPAAGDDHNIYIYYPNSMGGGVKTLFRKVGNKSADYLPDHPGTVRRNGSFIYEEFLTTGGTDVKVYTVGPRYAHAEARKSPVVDGKVQRTVEGKEVRFPVLLTPAEKDMARGVSHAFRQKVCGFDLLRSDTGKSYVCDVNGWSFVKNSKKYYDDTAGILRNIILTTLAPHRLQFALPKNVHAEELSKGNDLVVVEEEEKTLPDLSDLEAEMEHTNQVGANEELRCVLAVIRHGDRTPKQKMKVKVSHQQLIDIFVKYKDAKGKQAKLKAPAQLQEFLDAVVRVLAEEPGAAAPAAAASDAALDDMRTRLRIVKTVLEHGGAFCGINRKVQLKPTKEDKAMGTVEELLLIVKWGGVLTHLGRRQAEDLGFIYRMVMYPRTSDGGGLLRLHSTYRHDIKCHSSDEGRVQTTAAAFIKALLDLEGSSLTPILVSLVNRDAGMLDAFGKGASEDIIQSKQMLYQLLTLDPETGTSHCSPLQIPPQQTSPPTSPRNRAPVDDDWPLPAASADLPSCSDSPEAAQAAMHKIGHMPENPLALLRQLEASLCVLVDDVRMLLLKHSKGEAFGGKEERKFYSAMLQDYGDYEQEPGVPYGVESMLMMYDRWRKLLHSFYNKKDDTFDISKIPDIYDSAKYDCIHNKHLELDYTKVFPLAKQLADCVIGAEYGLTPEYKMRISSKIAQELLGKLMLDIHNVRQESLTSAAAEEAGAGLDSDYDEIHGDEFHGEESMLGSAGPEADTVHRLAPQYVDDVNSPLRHVRTRMYFTSESHIHALINILLYNEAEGQGVLSEEGRRMLTETLEYDYLSQIVLRMYENKSVPNSSEDRFRIELMFSNGANYNPLETQVQCTRPRTPIHRGKGVSLQALERHLGKFAAERTHVPDSNMAYIMSHYSGLSSARPTSSAGLN